MNTILFGFINVTILASAAALSQNADAAHIVGIGDHGHSPKRMIPTSFIKPIPPANQQDNLDHQRQRL